MATTPDQANRNRILAAVGAEKIGPLLADLEEVDLPVKKTLYQWDQPIRQVFFPLSGVVSVIARANEGEVVEVATVGSEGMAGLPAFLGARTSSMTAFSQIAGDALQMPRDRFERHCDEVPELREALLRYTQAFITQIAQNSACNRLHPIEERCARWLLMTHDRVDSDEFQLTQEFLAQMLGVRRPSVSLAAGALQHAGLIEYNRGVVRVVDRDALQELSCECYAIVEAEYDRLLGARHKARHKRTVRRGG